MGAEDLDVAQFALLVDREGDPHGAGGGTLVFAALVADIPEEPRVEPRGVFSLEERIDDLHVEFIPLCVDRMAFDRTKVPEVDGQQVANFDRLAVDQAGRPGRGFHDYAADFAHARGSQAETLSQPVMRPSLPMVTTALTTSLRSWAYSLSDTKGRRLHTQRTKYSKSWL